MAECGLCNEPIMAGAEAETVQPYHRSCLLRSTLGGIGHLIAHEYWCEQRHDPDAGLTYRQSARLVDAYVQVVGLERTVET